MIEADSFNPPNTPGQEPNAVPNLVQFHEVVQRLALDVEKVVPLHGRITTWEELVGRRQHLRPQGAPAGRGTEFAMSQATQALAGAAAPPAPLSAPRRVSAQLATLAGAVALLLTIALRSRHRRRSCVATTIPLTTQGQACLAIMAFAVLLWVTETVPFAVTSLLVVLLIPLFQLSDFRSVIRARLRRSDRGLLHRRADAVRRFHAIGAGTRLSVLHPRTRRHAHRPRAAGRAGRRHVHLVVDHGHGRRPPCCCRWPSACCATRT